MALGDYQAFVRELQCHLAAFCVPIYRETLLGNFLLLVKNVPISLSIFLVILQFYRPFRDVYYPLAITVGLLLNAALNYGLRALFDTSSPASLECGSRWELPSFSVQQACFFVTILITFPALWGAKIYALEATCAFIFLFGVTLSRVYVGYNGPDHVWLAGPAGVLFGALWQLFVYELLLLSARYNHALLRSWMPVLQYENGWCKEPLTGLGRRPPRTYERVDATASAVSAQDARQDAPVRALVYPLRTAHSGD